MFQGSQVHLQNIEVPRLMLMDYHIARHSQLGDEGLKQALSQYIDITDLDLSKNQIGPEGARTLDLCGCSRKILQSRVQMEGDSSRCTTYDHGTSV